MPTPRTAGRGILAAALFLASALAATGIVAAEADQPLAAVDDLPNPPEISSRDGVLSGTLTIAPARVTVAGRGTTSNVIDGDFVPPTLRVRRGDTIEVRAVNRIGKAAVP
ncbi:MAG TPA: hypothetical protein VFY87_31535 [Geminicoccaceae bacterium]|nr:hypothetical protein [Geminicoccaceae bacterium]